MHKDAACMNARLAKVVQIMSVDQAGSRERRSPTKDTWFRKVNKQDMSRKEAASSRKNILHVHLHYS